jgi:hypothetical protein
MSGKESRDPLQYMFCSCTPVRAYVVRTACLADIGTDNGSLATPHELAPRARQKCACMHVKPYASAPFVAVRGQQMFPKICRDVIGV